MISGVAQTPQKKEKKKERNHVFCTNPQFFTIPSGSEKVVLPIQAQCLRMVWSLKTLNNQNHVVLPSKHSDGAQGTVADILNIRLC